MGGWLGAGCRSQPFRTPQLKAIWGEYETESEALRAILVAERDRQKHKLQVHFCACNVKPFRGFNATNVLVAYPRIDLKS
jgi:hypothetical protein